MSGFAVLTGPITRELTLADGTVYDCHPAVVEVADEAHQQELMHLVGLHYKHNGHPHHDDDTPFVYEAEHAPDGFDKGYKPHADNKLKGL